MEHHSQHVSKVKLPGKDPGPNMENNLSKWLLFGTSESREHIHIPNCTYTLGSTKMAGWNIHHFDDI